MRNSIHRRPPPPTQCVNTTEIMVMHHRELSLATGWGTIWTIGPTVQKWSCVEHMGCYESAAMVTAALEMLNKNENTKCKHIPPSWHPAGFFFCFLFECAFTCSSTLCSYQGHKATNAAGGSQAAFGRRVSKEQGRGQDKCKGGAGFTDPSEGCCHPGGALQHHWEPQTVPLLVLFYLIFCLFKTN